jgi:hypothetical protein
MNENSENIIRKLQSISTVENYDENLTNALGGIYSLFSQGAYILGLSEFTFISPLISRPLKTTPNKPKPPIFPTI